MAVAVPDDFDEESIWGHCLRHKLAADDGDLRKLIFALSVADASALQRCSAQTTESFVRTLSGMLKAEPWLQAEACSIFAGMCRMDKSKFADIINKDWFVISILRMLREPPEEQTLTTILGVIRDVVADSSSRPENIAWMCTPSVIDICLSMVDSPFHDSCLALVELMMTACTQLGAVALESFVRLGTQHANARFFGETMLRIMNESEVDDESPLPASYRPTLTVLGYIHAGAESADFLYPADQKILLDVLVRHGASIKTNSREAQETWLAWTRTVGGIVRNSSNYKEEMHLAAKILETMEFLQGELASGSDAHKVVEEFLADTPTVQMLIDNS